MHMTNLTGGELGARTRPTVQLTDTEQAVLDVLARAGTTYRDAAVGLGLSPDAVLELVLSALRKASDVRRAFAGEVDARQQPAMS